MNDDPLDRDWPRPPSASGGPASGSRPVRKDEIEIEERGIYIESWLPERRSRRRPLFYVHGELAGSWLWERWLRYFAGRGWEGHALNLGNHYWSRTADPQALSFETYLDDVTAGLERVGPNAVAVGHGMGGLLVLKAAAERVRVAGLVLLDAEAPAAIRPPGEAPRRPGRPAGLRTRRARLGDPPREAPAREPRPLPRRGPADPAPARPEAEGVGPGPRVDAGRRPGAAATSSRACRRSSSARGSRVPPPRSTAERLADWLGAEHEQFGASSHYGLVLSEEGHRQVADRVRAFLETHRL